LARVERAFARLDLGWRSVATAGNISTASALFQIPFARPATPLNEVLDLATQRLERICDRQIGIVLVGIQPRAASSLDLDARQRQPDVNSVMPPGVQPLRSHVDPDAASENIVDEALEVEHAFEHARAQCVRCLDAVEGDGSGNDMVDPPL